MLILYRLRIQRQEGRILWLANTLGVANIIDMGTQISGTTKFQYRTKNGLPIQYIFWDLKGKTRFPHEPSNENESTPFLI